MNGGNGTQVNASNSVIQLRTDGTGLKLQILCNGGGAATVGGYRTFAPYFRDNSAWYHIVLAADTTQATAANRYRGYINGVEITSYTGVDPNQNVNITWLNTAVDHLIGRNNEGGGPVYGDTYITEMYWIDGQQLTPSSFGETNAITGVWQPKKYAGTYGTNGFYLNFSDNSGVTATTIGKDYSGNGNNWTPNNISVTAGVTYDSMLDVPTLYADGGNGRGNYCTLNPLNQNSVITLSAGNLSFTASNNRFTTGTFAVTSGKWYWEFYPVAGGASGVGVGAISATTYVFGTAAFSTAAGYIGVGYTSNGSKYISGTSSAYGATYGSGNVIGVALDLDSGTKTITFYKDNISQGSINLPTSSEAWIVATDYSEAGTHSINFGQRPFTYTPPTGFVALNTQNLPTPTISNGATVMAATLYTGNATARTIANTVNGVSMQPDLVWLKMRSSGSYLNHHLVDSVRGDGKVLYSNLTNAEDNLGSTAIYTTSTGFGLSAGVGVNENSQTFVGWQWNAGGTTVTNTSGTISAQVRANATAGFSVVTWTGAGSAGTIGHGLGVTPSMIIIKNRSGTQFWFVNHTSISATQNLYLNDTASVQSDGIFTSRGSTTFGVGAGVAASSTNYVAYCFAAVAGYSAFGSYTANASADGPFIYTGFRPRWIMLKRSSVAGAPWSMFDTSRNTYNSTNLELDANASSAESTSGNGMDILSNGFKLRDSVYLNSSSGNTFIYAAFAENPFKLSLAR